MKFRRPLALRFFIFAASLAASPFAFAQTDGTPRWAGPFTTGGYIVSSPAIAPDGTIYVGTQDKRLYAITPSGSLKWSFLTGDWVDSSPAVDADGTIYFGSWDGKFYALTPDGVKKWEYSTGVGNYIYSSPAIGADGTIYFGAGDGNFYALRPNGTLKWTYPAGDWIDSSPAIGANGFIYYGSWDGVVYAVRDDGTSAREMWRFATNGPVLASPATGRDGTVYISANDGRLYALDGTTGNKRWEFAAGGTLEGSPVVGPDGTVYLGGSTGYLHAIGADGALKWKFPTIDPIASTPAVRADGTVIFGSGNSSIFALQANGDLKWKINTGDWVDSSPVVAPNGTIYVGSYDKKIYAFNGSGSPASGFSDWPMFRRGAQRSARVAAVAPGGRLANLSIRAQVGPGVNLIPGFVVTGTVAKQFLVRAVGPTLAEFKVAGQLLHPSLELHTTIGGIDTILAQNDNWGAAANSPAIASAAALTGAFALPVGSLDAAILFNAQPRSHSALVKGSNGGSGIVLVEVYDTDSGNPAARLINLSTRGQVGVGDSALTPGLVIGGAGPLRLLVRAVGPTLAQFGVPGTLDRPTLTLFSGANSIGTNTGWTTGGNAADVRAAAQVAGAFALGDTSADSVLLVTLEPGAYTMRIAGVGDTIGEALVEVYVVQ